ncbi:uncharacterized protein LOC141649424 [Silene latifolia]|uniref:uncharacterized protein LOC141649424 n=1 Tax=Silene latifolia TaxID=37657 RepID=UPI003D772D05
MASKLEDEFTANPGKWHEQPEGYPPASCYQWLKGHNPQINWRKVVWNGWSLPKHNFMGWIWAHEAMLTNNKLFLYGVTDDNSCQLCGVGSETQEHLIGTKAQKEIQFAMVLCAVYQVWEQRNKCRMKMVLIQPEVLAKGIVNEMRSRIRERDKKQMRIDDLEWLASRNLL